MNKFDLKPKQSHDKLQTSKTDLSIGTKTDQTITRQPQAQLKIDKYISESRMKKKLFLGKKKSSNEIMSVISSPLLYQYE